MATDTLGRRIITTQGDTIIMNKALERTMHISGSAKSKTATGNEHPVMLNGVGIHYFETNQFVKDGIVNNEVLDGFYKLSRHIESALSNILDSLKGYNYSYRVDNIVVNEQGKIVYYETTGLSGRAATANWRPIYSEIPEHLAVAFNTQLIEALNSIKLPTVIVNEVAVPYYTYHSSNATGNNKVSKQDEPKPPQKCR